MPLFTYSCPKHGEFDEVLKVAEMTPTRKCPKCGKLSKKVIVLGHGGVFPDEQPSWLASACQTLLTEDDPPLKTRGEYKAYLKKHGIWERGGREI